MDLSELDLKGVSDLESFSGIIPLFPLSTVVFFPNTLLPLHIFEPRYKQMVNDVINTEKIIGMALLKPGWGDNYYETPEIYDTVGMGRIVSSQSYGDGRINIVLYGLKRVRIVEVVENLPYRLARVDIVDDLHGSSEQTLRLRIGELITRWNLLIENTEKSHRIEINTNLPLDRLTDALGTLIFTNVFDKQTLLEEPSVEKRAQILIRDLETRLEIISVTSSKRNEIIKKRHLN
jgi:uncharacterized protein